MRGLEVAIEETLARPQQVIESISDPQVHLYYRYYIGTRVGNKLLCAVVKLKDADAFLLTAYLTDKIKKGVMLWPRKN